jgi:hypothetical protein
MEKIEPGMPTPASTGMEKPNGPVVAAMLAAGVGTLVLGILTTLAEASEGVHEFLEFSERVGPLSGKVTLAVAAFLVTWGGLHLSLRTRELEWKPAITATVALLAAGFVLTFPPFFQLFESD